MLMVDNLMDLTHLGYVHATTIGGNPAQHVEAKMETERTPLGLKFTRWMLNSLPPPTYVRAVGFRAASTVASASSSLPPDRSCNGPVRPRRAPTATAIPAAARWSSACSTGLRRRLTSTCFYFWSAANGFRQDDPAATEQFFEQVAAAFLEDKTVVEGQHARLAELGEGALVDIATDAARLHMRRTVERLLENERRAGLAAA